MKPVAPAAALAFLFAAAPAFAQTDAIGDGVAELPIFDAHMHYKQPADAATAAIKARLRDRFGLEHATVEVERATCADEE